MATPNEPVRYKVTDRKQFLEMLSVPNLFLDGDYNTNTWLIWDFIGQFFEETFGTVRTDDFNINLVGQDILINPGTIFHKFFYFKETSGNTLNNVRIANTIQYIYAKVTHERITINEDPGQFPVLVRQNIGGTNYSRPNQYQYKLEYVVSPNILTSNIGNIPDNPLVADEYYLLLATVDASDVVTQANPLFDKVASESQIIALQNDIISIQNHLGVHDSDIISLQLQINQNVLDITTLQTSDLNNAKKSIANIFTHTQTLYYAPISNYNSTTGELTLDKGNLASFNTGSNILLNKITSKGIGTVIKIRFIGSGNITIVHNNSKIINPGNANIICTQGDWVEFTESATGIWDITGNSSNLTRRMIAAETTISTHTSQIASLAAGGSPVGGIMLWSGSIITIPSNWQLCNGSVINDVLSPINGQNTPDLRGRFIVGASSDSGEANKNLRYNVNAVGPAATQSQAGPNFDLEDWGEDVRLQVPSIPSHSHTGGFAESVVAFGNSSAAYLGNNTNVGATGGNQTHENRPPYYALAYIIKIK